MTRYDFTIQPNRLDQNTMKWHEEMCIRDRVGLTLACLNIKKLVKMMTGKTYNFTQISQYYWIIGELGRCV